MAIYDRALLLGGAKRNAVFYELNAPGQNSGILLGTKGAGRRSSWLVAAAAYSPRKTGRRFSSMARRPSLASALWRARPEASSRSACSMLERSEIAR